MKVARLCNCIEKALSYSMMYMNEKQSKFIDHNALKYSPALADDKSDIFSCLFRLRN